MKTEIIPQNENKSSCRAPFGKITRQIALLSSFITTPRLTYRSRRNVSLNLNKAYFHETPERATAYPATDDQGGQYVVLEIFPPTPQTEQEGVVPVISNGQHIIHFFPNQISITDSQGKEILSFQLSESNSNVISQFLKQSQGAVQ